MAALQITTSADLTVDTRFAVIVNSISPEFQSSGSDSGINFSVWKTLTGYGDEGEKPAPIKYDQTAFAAAASAHATHRPCACDFLSLLQRRSRSQAGASPTYADVLWSEVPKGAAPPGSALKYIVHALVREFALTFFCSAHLHRASFRSI